MIFRSILKPLGSLKIAVVSILSLAAVLSVATFYEASYGTRAVQVGIYGTIWFSLLLLLLATNVLSAALVRYPWKRHQTGFVITHLGILVILFGSAVTQRWGVDGNLPIVEKQRNNEVILSNLVLGLYQEDGTLLLEMPIPETAQARFQKLFSFSLGKQSFEASAFVPRALPNKTWVANEKLGVPALQVELFNTRFDLENWLVQENPDEVSKLELGPAVVQLKKMWSLNEEEVFLKKKRLAREATSKGFIEMAWEGKKESHSLEEGQKGVSFFDGKYQLKIKRYLPHAVVMKDRLVSKSEEALNPAVEIEVLSGGEKLQYTLFSEYPEFNTQHHKGRKNPGAESIQLRFVSLKNQKAEKAVLDFRVGFKDPSALFYKVFSKTGALNSEGRVAIGREVATGWMDLKFKVAKFFPSAVADQSPQVFHESSQEGLGPALQIKSQGEKFWLFEGDTRLVSLGNKSGYLYFSKKRLPLPFLLELEKFRIRNDPGTEKAASYESEVSVFNEQGKQQSKLVSMNEPLKFGGYTFYQASYQLEEGKAPISVFSVNYDPGRFVKYAGSIILVLGIALMFYMNPHYWNNIMGRKS